MAETPIPEASWKATLTDERSGRSYELPVREATLGPPVIDIQGLYGRTGYFTFDPGYTSTGSCAAASAPARRSRPAG